MPSAEEIVELWRFRRNNSDITLSRMRRIRDVYNGDLVLPFAEETEPAVANLVLMGVDQKAGRIASVVPQIYFPPAKPGTKTSEERSQHKREAVRAWWDDNDISAQLTARARHLVAYGRTVVMLAPDSKMKVPRWKVRNPLSVFASDEVEYPGCPSDIIAAHNKPFAWFRQHYPELAARANHDGHYKDQDQVVLLEYSDAEEYALVFGGIDTTYIPGYVSHQWETDTWSGFAADLIRLPNRAGRTLAAIAARPTLDREQGEMDQMVGMYGAQAKLTALQMDAIEKAIYPDTYLISRPNEQARFVRGPFDGRSGEVNIISGGEVQTINDQPGWMTDPLIDRLERSQRLTGGIPAEFGGESTTNVRTGRRGDAIMSAVVDFPLAEAQNTLAKSLQQEDAIAIQIAKAYWGSSKVSYHYVEGRKLRGGTYTPNELFEGPLYHKVSYPVAGADMNNLIVGVGQRIGLGTMSKQSAAELDPLIDDPELETDRMTAEGLHAALLASVQNAAAEGGMPPQVVGRIMELVRSNKLELHEAIAKAQEEAAEEQEQAQAQPTGMEEALAQEAAQGMGEPQAVPQVGEPGASLGNLQQLMTNLRRTGTRQAGREVLG
ncbi:MAG: hypothetical protein ACLFWM_08905 [Actinomycetota bacterium]